MVKKEIQLANEQATLELGAQVAEQIVQGNQGAVIFLDGPLGAGKTTLVRGFLRQLGYQGSVKSPTYTLLEPYQLGDLVIIHMDLYRLVDTEELSFLGLEDYFQDSHVIALIEWPRNAQELLPQPTLQIQLEPLVTGGRRAVINT